MWVPIKLHDALPAIYLTSGILIILGALYIGIDDGLMIGYLIVGLACVVAGMLDKAARYDAHSEKQRSEVELGRPAA